MKERLALELILFLLAVKFLTRVPVPAHLPHSDDLNVRSAKYFPLVGTLIGVAAAIIWLPAVHSLPPLAAALLALSMGVTLTGGFHERGLAITAETLGHDGSHRQALRRIRSRQAGAFGAMALGLTLALTASLIAALTPLQGAVLLIAANGISRMAVIHTQFTTRDVREKMRRRVALPVTPDGYRIGLATAIALLAMLVATVGLAPAIGAITVSIVMGQAIRLTVLARLGGYTGATLGAVQQISSLGVYIGAIWLF